MKYLKTFNESNNLRDDDVMWHVGFTSTIPNTYGLTEEEIKEAVFAINDPIQLDFDKEMADTRDDDYGPVGNEMANWQFTKSDEISDLFRKNLTCEVSGNNITVTTEFELTFPNDWDRGDVLDWTVGFHELQKSYTFVQAEKIASGQPRNKELYDKCRAFLNDLTRKQKVDIRLK